VFVQGESEEALSLSARAADVHLFAASADLRGLIETLDTLAVRAGRSVEFGVIQPVLARDEAEDAQRDAERAGLPDTAIVGSYAKVAERLADLARSACAISCWPRRLRSRRRIASASMCFPASAR
jgi:alkanesulfonate monooxygenase